MLLTILRWVISKLNTFAHEHPAAPHLVELGGFVLAIFIGILIWRHHAPHYTETVRVPGEVRVVTVDKPVLTEKIVTKVLSDPKDKALIQQLMAENAKLKVNVTELSQTVGSLQQHGGGIIIQEGPTTEHPETPVTYHYSDWHLDFKTDTKTASYDLNQKFEVLNTSGKDKDGNPTSLVKLFEIGKDGERIPVTDLQTVGIFANPLTAHWIFSPRIQAGLAFTRTATGQMNNGGVAALQWLKHGRTKAAEDTTFALFSPAFFFGPGQQDIGILPFSVNVGRIPHQPFTNLWVSGFVAKSQRLGITVTATF